MPPPEWHNRDLFPDCGYDPFADKRYDNILSTFKWFNCLILNNHEFVNSMVPLSESIGITSALDKNLTNSPTGSPSLSFAKVYTF